MIVNPTVGQKIVFNDLGLDIVYGSTLGLNHMKTKVLTITDVDSIPMVPAQNGAPDLVVIEVDDPQINEYFLNNFMFDLKI